MKLPYSSSTAGVNREAEIRETLRGAGATAIGFMVDDDRDEVVAQFRIAGRVITIPISVAAYEQAWLRANKRGPRTDAKDHAEKHGDRQRSLCGVSSPTGSRRRWP